MTDREAQELRRVFGPPVTGPWDESRGSMADALRLGRSAIPVLLDERDRLREALREIANVYPISGIADPGGAAFAAARTLALAALADA